MLQKSSKYKSCSFYHKSNENGIIFETLVGKLNVPEKQLTFEKNKDILLICRKQKRGIERGIAQALDR